jgi:hypothetical protein
MRSEGIILPSRSKYHPSISFVGPKSSPFEEMVRLSIAYCCKSTLSTEPSPSSVITALALSSPTGAESTPGWSGSGVSSVLSSGSIGDSSTGLISSSTVAGDSSTGSGVGEFSSSSDCTSTGACCCGVKFQVIVLPSIIGAPSVCSDSGVMVS